MVVRYSQIYARSDTLSKDSRRMRKRVEALFNSVSKRLKDIDIEIAKKIEAKCGVDVIQHSSWGDFVSWKTFFSNCEVRDLLDSPSLARAVFLNKSEKKLASDFMNEFALILDEESVGYALDDNGVVHPKIDLEFERNRISAIASLRGDKYVAARSYVMNLEECLLSEPLEGRAAVRAVFDVVENVFKVNTPKANQLNSQNIMKHFTPKVQRIYAENGKPSLAMKQIEGFKAWVDAAHPLRHAGSDENLVEPPDDIVIHTPLSPKRSSTGPPQTVVI